MATINAPVKEFNGVVAGVHFAEGKAETDNEAAIQYFERQGYGVERPAEKPVEQKPAGSLEGAVCARSFVSMRRRRVSRWVMRPGSRTFSLRSRRRSLRLRCSLRRIRLSLLRSNVKLWPTRKQTKRIPLMLSVA